MAIITNDFRNTPQFIAAQQKLYRPDLLEKERALQEQLDAAHLARITDINFLIATEVIRTVNHELFDTSTPDGALITALKSGDFKIAKIAGTEFDDNKECKYTAVIIVLVAGSMITATAKIRSTPWDGAEVEELELCINGSEPQDAEHEQLEELFSEALSLIEGNGVDLELLASGGC